MQVVCPSCQAINRIPENKDAREAKCGKCSSALFTGHAVEVDAAGFKRHLEKNEIPVVVDFWASWCGPCQMMAPHFTAAASMLEPGYRLIKLNTENAQQVSAQWGIRSIPTMIVYKNGHEAGRMSGAMDKNQIINWVRQY